MNRARAAWIIAGAEVAVLAATVILAFLSRPAFSPPVGPGVETILTLVVPAIAYPIVGALIASSRPDHAMGWLCLAIGGLWFTSTFQITYAAYGVVVHPGALPGAALVGALDSWIPPTGLIGTFFLLLFPNGRLVSPRWRPVAWTSGFAIFGATVSATLSTRTVVWFGGTHNPVLPEGRLLSIVDIFTTIFYVLLFASIVASVLSLFVRYRRATSDERHKIKWIAFAGALFFAFAGGSFLSWNVGDTHPSVLSGVVQGSLGVGLGLIPAAALFAVLRYRLYDIDRVISRTLSYAIVTAMLAASYAVVALVPTAVIGSGHVPDGLVAAAVLVVAAGFRPIRRRVQAAVDHRFNRSRYDAERTVETFASRLRDEVDMTTLKDDLEGVVHRTMQPAHVSLWLRDG